jgi:hypothetical protein
VDKKSIVGNLKIATINHFGLKTYHTNRQWFLNTTENENKNARLTAANTKKSLRHATVKKEKFF